MPSALRLRSLVALGLGLCALAPAPAALAAGKPGKAKKEPAPKLPDAPARLWIIAPSAEGPWTMRIDNDGTEPIRVPADVRLLSMELDTHEKGKRPLKCAAPSGMRPEGFPNSRAVLLAPGQSYVETFDPHLLCFGKAAEGLRGSVEVRTRFGWSPPSKYSHAAPKPPFAAEGTAFPATVAPLRQLVAPTMVLSFAKPAEGAAPTEQAPAAKPEDPKKAPDAGAPNDAPSAKSPGDGAGEHAGAAKSETGPDAANEPGAAPDPAKKAGDDAATKKDDATAPAIVDENAGRLELELGEYADAGAARSVRIDARITNAGHRPITAALRPRMLAFRVSGPSGVQRCDAAPPTQAMPREGFHTLGPGSKVSFSILLAEECPELKLDRPGLYRVEATLRALEKGDRLGIEAWTGVVGGNDAALVRIATGPAPFYAHAPAAVATPKPAPPEDDPAD